MPSAYEAGGRRGGGRGQWRVKEAGEEWWVMKRADTSSRVTVRLYLCLAFTLMCLIDRRWLRGYFGTFSS